MEDRWLSVEEIAPYPGVNRDTIYKWIERTNMPARMVGRLSECWTSPSACLQPSPDRPSGSVRQP